MNKFVEKYKNKNFSGGVYETEEYKTFQRSAKKDLKAQCTEHGLLLEDFKDNHFSFSAVIRSSTDDTKYSYISITDVRYFPTGWNEHVLYRTMKHKADWTGGQNHYCRWEEIGSSVSRLMKEGA